MKYDDRKLEQLSLADLIALETFMERRRTHWTKVALDFPEDSTYHTDAVEHNKICTAIRDAVAGLVSVRLNEIFPDYEV